MSSNIRKHILLLMRDLSTTESKGISNHYKNVITFDETVNGNSTISSMSFDLLILDTRNKDHVTFVQAHVTDIISSNIRCLLLTPNSDSLTDDSFIDNIKTIIPANLLVVTKALPGVCKLDELYFKLINTPLLKPAKPVIKLATKSLLDCLKKQCSTQ